MKNKNIGKNVIDFESKVREIEKKKCAKAWCAECGSKFIHITDDETISCSSCGSTRIKIDYV
ncbi:hypothetical protein M0R19_05320 [Candidatus Pacearchaeota archaeon]|jgi:protein-arginine kinase activator protein McsA|nr:hypothetical protein [Candidatus Pacearchaeota archaeon]